MTEENELKMGVLKDIKENYKNLEKDICISLNYKISVHQPTTGTNREEIWEEFFRSITPKKFNIERGVFIIDSKKHCSKEVDIAIYDEQYTPYIFQYKKIRYIPIEAVAVVIQCKSTRLNEENLGAWLDSINVLETAKDSVVRLATYVHIGIKENLDSTQVATRPLRILACMSSDNIECQDKRFDIVIRAVNEKLDIKFSNVDVEKEDITINYLLNSLNKGNYIKNSTEIENNLLNERECYKNNYKEKYKKECEEKYPKDRNIAEDYSIKDCTLLSFIFQFNQILMLINNPMFFPHMAYVKMFNEIIEDDEEKINK